MFGRKKKNITKDELEKLRQEAEALEKEKEELEKLLEKRRKEVDILKEKVKIGKRVYVLIPVASGGIKKVKGKITVSGLQFRYARKKYTVVWDPSHIFFMKHGWGAEKATVFVDLEKGVTVPPPAATGVRGTKEIDAAAVQAVLSIYRSLVLGQRREQAAMLFGLIIAVAALAVVAIMSYMWGQQIAGTLKSLQETIQQLQEFIKNYQMPTPVPGP